MFSRSALSKHVDAIFIQVAQESAALVDVTNELWIESREP